MKTNPRLNLSLLGALALPIFALAQTTGTPTSTPTSTTTDPRGSPTTPGVTATPAKSFTAFETASPAVQAAVTSATASTAQVVGSLEEGIRLGIITLPTARPGPAGTPTTPATQAAATVATAVTQASTVIVDDSRTTRAPSLTERDAAIARLRLTQSEGERQRAISDLRERSGQRLEDQREAARLVRDRIRQLRDNTTIIRPQ